MTGFAFQVVSESKLTAARVGLFDTPHGEVQTPAFMPVGTRGTVKGLMPRDLQEAGSRIILGNTYHLHLRPSDEVIEDLGGLHAVMNWQGPILTDSGGYQVFSLGDTARIDENGVSFKSIVDGSKIRFTAERVMEIQKRLGADIVMAFDQCPADPTDRQGVAQATDRTHRWLERCVRWHRDNGGEDRGQALFGIVQGGAFPDLREESLQIVTEHNLVGYAVGGVSVGESREQMQIALEATGSKLPRDKPRYLMGVGTPRDFFDAIERGFDLFDCVTPTRHGRTASAYTSQGRLNLRNQKWVRDTSPLDPECACPTCTGWSKGTLRHLVKVDEMLGAILLSLHNVYYFHTLMRRIRAAIAEDRLQELRTEVLGEEPGTNPSS